jgi:hypothetical protein
MGQAILREYNKTISTAKYMSASDIEKAKLLNSVLYQVGKKQKIEFLRLLGQPIKK